ncbi:oligosaccharide flippase family protein [Endozoicomonas arenosclerae]|uniref:oligosaccharide flippase family protein n=1 Tax=Endozoicomonas arenosclerae TaxID=1633495 RepID=UPI000783E7BD|nr:oligosaccharide flippase family protein [Endozoicomonas arenosclerae]
MDKTPFSCQALYILAGRLALPVGAFLLLVILGQVSDKILGEYALVTTYYFVLQTLPLMGLMPFYMREVARQPEKAGSYYVSVALMVLACCALINVVLWQALKYTAYSAEVVNAIALSGLAIIPGILAFLGEITLTSLHRSRPVAYIAIIENVLRLTASIALVLNDHGIESLIVVLLATRTISFLLYLVALKRVTVNFSIFKADRNFIGKARSVLPVFLLNTVLALLLSRLDFIILSLFEEISTIGFYAIGYRLFEIASIAISAILSAIYPTLSRAWHVNPAQFRWRVRTFLPGFFFFSIFIALTGFSFAETYVALLFPNQFPHPVFVSQLFLLLIMVHSIDCTLSQILNAMNLQRRDTLTLSLSTPLYLALLYLLVPTMSMNGAFIATALTLSFQMMIRYLFVRRTAPSLFSMQEAGLVSVLLITLFLLALELTESSLIEKLTFTLLATITVWVIMSKAGLLKPFHTLALFYSRKAKAHDDVNSRKTLFHCLAFDFLRYQSWQKRKFRDQPRISNFSFHAVFLLRLSRYLLLKNCHRLSRLTWQLNTVITKSDIRPCAQIGPGLVLDAPTAVGISGKVGHSASLLAHTALGRTGNKDVGFGLGQPVAGHNLLLKQRAYLLGGLLIPNRTSIKPHVQIDKPRLLKGGMDD